MSAAPTAHGVRRFLSEACPDVAALDLQPVDEGGEHSTWWVGSRYVLRLARDPDASARQRREVALRETLQRHLDVPVPSSALSGAWAPGLTYTLDVRLSGVSAERRPVTERGERQLADLLTGLRAFPLADATALNVPAAAPARDLARLADEATAAGHRLGHGDATHIDELAFLAHTPAVATESRLLHHDLKGEHLLIDARGGVGGVIDWTDAVLGDPAEDIAGVVISVGAPAALRVAALAGYDSADIARGLFLARADTLVRLADRLRGTDPDSPLPLLRDQRQRAWRGTPLDPAR